MEYVDFRFIVPSGDSSLERNPPILQVRYSPNDPWSAIPTICNWNEYFIAKEQERGRVHEKANEHHS